MSGEVTLFMQLGNSPLLLRKKVVVTFTLI